MADEPSYAIVLPMEYGWEVVQDILECNLVASGSGEYPFAMRGSGSLILQYNFPSHR